MFDSLDEAREYCERAADASSRVRFDIFDHEGRVNPPLLTIVPRHVSSLDGSPAVLRRRSIAAWTGLAFGVVLCIYAWPQRGSGDSVWSALIGINLILFAGRFFWINFAEREVERTRQKRLANAARAASTADPTFPSGRPTERSAEGPSSSGPSGSVANGRVNS